MNKASKFKKNNGGFLVLTMVLLVCATVMIISTGILLRSVSEISSTTDSEKSLRAWGAVNACGEYALLQMIASTTSTTTTANNWDFASTTGVELTDVGGGDETCYIYPVVASGTAKIIKASSTVSSFTRKIQIEVATNTPNMAVTSWEAVADF
jgi:hypothetical protein